MYNRGVTHVDDTKVVSDIKAVVDETRAFWDEKPWRKYAFLIAFRRAGGGLEHMHSTSRSTDTVSYYIKGEIAGFLLDAHIRRLSNGARRLDDVIKAAYQRYSGEKGFRPEEFTAVAEEAAKAPLGDWFASVVGAASEVDYSEATNWFGLRLITEEAGDKQRWQLSVAPDRSEEQKQRLRDWLGPE